MVEAVAVPVADFVITFVAHVKSVFVVVQTTAIADVGEIGEIVGGAGLPCLGSGFDA